MTGEVRETGTRRSRRDRGTQAGLALGVIPARWAATRLPGKSLVSLCGKPLIQWVVERCSAARTLDALVVATDDRRIAAAVRRLGVQVVMTRADHPSGTDRVAEAVRGRRAEIVVNVQGDEPLMDPRLIDRLVKVMRAGQDWDMATAAVPIESDRDLADRAVVKVVTGRSGAALYFSRAPIPCFRDAALSPHPRLHRRHLGIYAYRKKFLLRFVRTRPSELERAEKLEQLRALHIGGRIKVLEAAGHSVSVDVPEDIPRAEAALRAAGLA